MYYGQILIDQPVPVYTSHDEQCTGFLLASVGGASFYIAMMTIY